MDPGPYTLRELVWMAEARGRDQWTHTSSVLALIANVNRDPKKTRPYKPSDFNPYEARRSTAAGIPITKQTLGMLKSVFVNNQPGGTKR